MRATKAGSVLKKTLVLPLSLAVKAAIFVKYLIVGSVRGNVRLLNIVSLNNSGAECRLHIPARDYKRVDPKVFDQNEFIRQTEAEWHRKNATSPEAWVGELRSVHIVHDGMIVTSNGEIVFESLINRTNFRRIDSIFRISKTKAVSCQNFNDNSLNIKNKSVLMSQNWDGNYGHWLIESLPRLLMVEKLYDISTLNILLFRKEPRINDVYVRSLHWLGVPEKNIIWIDHSAFVDHVVYPTPVTIQPWIKSEICVEALERVATLVMKGERGALKKIYISRNSDSTDRKLVNEDEIIAIARSKGYVVVSCGDHDFEEQVRLFAGATHIIGNVGAGFVNMAFAPRGVRVLALTSPLMPDNFFYDLASLKRGHYWSIHGQGCGVRQDYRDNFTIDQKRFASIFEEFEADETPSTALAP